MGASSFDDRLDEANSQLEKCKLRVKRGKLYIRATFPPKPGEQEGKRHELGTGCGASLAGLRVAIAKAREVDSQLLWGRFDWGPWLKEKREPSDRVEAWTEAFEQAWWEKTERNPTKESSFQSCYRHYFRQLPGGEPLSLELLRRSILEKSEPATRSREMYCMAYRKLAEFVCQRGAIDPGQFETFKRELSELKRGYEPEVILPEQLPSEEKIVETWQSIDDPAWRWVYGMIATYGLRPSEVFRLDTLRFTRHSEALRVLESTKTGARLTYPCPASWREQFKLWEIRYPAIEGIQEKSNETLGKKIAQEFRERKIDHIPYSLRHAWCIRLVLTGTVDSAIAAKWAGHSLTVHEKTYLQAISEAQFSRVFERMKSGENSKREEPL